MAPLKLVSLNIEGNRHVERVFPLLEKAEADIICLQEVLETEFHLLRRILHMHGMFAPVTRIGPEESRNISGSAGIEGVGLLTRLPFKDLAQHYYWGSHSPIPDFVLSDMDTVSRAIIITTIEKDGASYTVGTTHFTWTPDGQADDKQRRDMKSLLKILAGIPEIILVGDFNAPRGREIWSALAARYKDNIPASCETTIEGSMSRYRNLRLVVDGFFTTPQFQAMDVKLVPKISDHYAIEASIIRIK